MSTLTDDDLTRVLNEVAASYDVPSRGAAEILAALTSAPIRRSVLRRRWVPVSSAAALVVVGVVLVAGQHGGGGSGALMSTAARTDRALTYDKYAPPPAAAPGAPSFGTAQSAPDAAARTGAPDSLAGALAPPMAAVPTDGGDSRVVKSGSIALVVMAKQVSSTLTALQAAAKSQGGYIAASSSDEYGDTPSGEVTIRVPVVRFENLVAAVRGLDAKVRTASMTGKDVTAEYADLESQVRTLRATRERFLVILSQTKTIGEILTVQQRVDSVSGEIDRIEGQRKLLASQSDLSTLTVSVSEAGDPNVMAASRPRSGLSQAFQEAKNGFVTGVEAIIRHSGGFLLVVICGAVLLLVGRLGWRVARRRLV